MPAMRQILIFDPATLMGVAQMRGPARGLPLGPDRIEVPLDLDLGDVTAWRVDVATRMAEKIGRPPTREEVNQERDARISAGFMFGGVHYQFRPEDKQRVTGAASLAGFAMLQGALPGDYTWHGGESAFSWIAADNSVTLLDAQSTFALGQAAADHEAAHIFAAKALKDAATTPVDFTADQYWPPRPVLADPDPMEIWP